MGIVDTLISRCAGWYRIATTMPACADRLGLFPLCEEYATRAHSYGDDMADSFALVARAQRRQDLIADAAATASFGARIHPTNPAIARELALALVALGRYKEARGPADLATDTYKAAHGLRARLGTRQPRRRAVGFPSCQESQPRQR